MKVCDAWSTRDGEGRALLARLVGPVRFVRFALVVAIMVHAFLLAAWRLDLRPPCAGHRPTARGEGRFLRPSPVAEAGGSDSGRCTRPRHRRLKCEPPAHPRMFAAGSSQMDDQGSIGACG